MHYFDKPINEKGLDPEKLQVNHLTRARHMFDLNNNQMPSLAFALYWLTLVRERYRAIAKIHPVSVVKRRNIWRQHYPYYSMFRTPSLFLQWYLRNNDGVLMGDPTGQYLIPINSNSWENKNHPFPDMLADNFTYSVLQYMSNHPKVRYTDKKKGYGFVEFTLPTYVYLNKSNQLKINRTVSGNKHKISGFLTEWEINEYLTSLIKQYVKRNRETMNDKYFRFLQTLIVGLYD